MSPDEKFGKRLNVLIAKEEAIQQVVPKPKIQKVPAILRGRIDSAKYYEPRWMSIGPVHYGNQKFQLAEEYKLQLAAKFIRDGHYSSWEKLYNQIEKDMVGLEECYNKEVVDGYKRTYKVPLNFILFFDGCAILQFIDSYCEGGHSEMKEMKMKNDLVAFTQHDLLLLENQIPYRVLELLMKARSEDSHKLQDLVDQFISMNVPLESKLEDFKASSVNPEPAHLLDLFLSAVLHQPQKQTTITVEDPNQNSSTATNPTSGNVQEPKIKQKQIHSDLEKQSPKWSAEYKSKKQQTFRSSVMDLKAAGINLKPSETSSLTDIQFSSLRFAVTLEIPPLIVDDSTGSKFLNLIAYEMCPDNTTTHYEVTSYISFLDSLIDYPSDVKMLRSAHILHNFLGNDIEVAQLFNNIATDLVPNPKVYEGVIDGIERHWKSRWMMRMAQVVKKWMVQVVNDHFSSPWTIVGLLAAAMAFFLSGIQTWFTVYSPPGPCDNFCQNLKKL